MKQVWILMTAGKTEIRSLLKSMRWVSSVTASHILALCSAHGNPVRGKLLYRIISFSILKKFYQKRTDTNKQCI